MASDYFPDLSDADGITSTTAYTLSIRWKAVGPDCAGGSQLWFSVDGNQIGPPKCGSAVPAVVSWVRAGACSLDGVGSVTATGSFRLDDVKIDALP